MLEAGSIGEYRWEPDQLDNGALLQYNCFSGHWIGPRLSNKESGIDVRDCFPCSASPACCSSAYVLYVNVACVDSLALLGQARLLPNLWRGQRWTLELEWTASAEVANRRGCHRQIAIDSGSGAKQTIYGTVARRLRKALPDVRRPVREALGLDARR